MPTPVRRRLRQARRGLGLAVAVSLVLVALVIGVANQLLPLAERNPDRVAAWLGERAGRPVAFSRVTTEWTRRGPLLTLEDLRIGVPGARDARDGILVGDAEMLVSLYAGLLPGTPFSELRLRGLDLTVERDPAGRWQVRGLPGQQQPGADPLELLEGLGELQVIGGRLAVDAPALGLRARLPRVDLRLRVDDAQLRAGLRAWAGGGSAPLDAALQLDRATGDGTLHAGARAADLAAWASWLHLAGAAPEAGKGRLEAWATLRGHRIDGFALDVALEDVRVAGAPLRDARGLVTVPRMDFASLQARAQWRRVPGGWRLDAPRLRLAPGGAGADRRTHVLDGLLLAGGEHAALAGPRLELGPLLSLAAMGDRLPPGLRGWLLAARPRVRLADVEFAARDGLARGQATIEAIGFDAAGDAPGLRGLAGTLSGDGSGFAFVPAADARVRVDWPRGFGRAHAFTLRGVVSGWREGGAWHVGTPGLRLAGGALDVGMRGALAWQGDGTRPRIDLAAEVDQAPITLAKGFWVRHRMPPAAVAWLDDALVEGTLEDGRVLLAGDLDDWPFRAGTGAPAGGLFRADVRIADGVLRFHRDWPVLEALDARASFGPEGFQVDGTGSIAGIEVTGLEAGIARYADGRLQVRAEGRGDAARLLALLRDSPLQARHGETLDHLQASGPAAVTFALQQPLLRSAGPARLSGTVSLAGARLREDRFDVAFDQVRGRADYTGQGFRAEGLQVRHAGRPGVLDLRAGAATRASSNAFEAVLAASLDADALLQRAPSLDWLAPHVAGRSDWRLALAIPREGVGRLRLDSDLVGTTLALPAPLAKPAAEPLAARVALPLPLDRGEVEVALGERLAVRARTGAAGTGVRAALGAATVASPPPANGLVATGHVATLSPIEWIGLASGGEEGAGGGMPLRGIDVTADRLLLFGGAFAGTRLQVDPAPGGARTVRVRGAAIDGTVRVPQADGATVSGRFARLHWRTSGAGDGDAENAKDAGDTSPTDADATASDVDPAQVPPLAFTIDDLRFNDARLGTASLRTRPVRDGLRIEHLRTRSAAHALELDGEWTGRGTAARTRLGAGFRSEDFGALLAGLGQGGRLSGGSGTARLDASWGGSPAQFELEALQGTLVVDVRGGRLLEVEPGAGRVLGLLSLAELPRRLTLDFRDLFSKGFAFNQLAGRLAFDDGVARSESLAMDGPAAAITIRGHANLRAQTFDQRIEVRPKAGNVLAVVGAIAGGPVGAALGAAANAVLQKPLGEAAARTYRVTGPWKDPEVEVVQRGDPPASTAPPRTPR